MESGLTDDERAEIQEFKLNSLFNIQRDITKLNDLRSLVEYTNRLLKIVLFPLNFFKYEREIPTDDQYIDKQLKDILNNVHDDYFKDKSVEPVDLVLFMCGFEPVCAERVTGLPAGDVTQTAPMLKNTTPLHKDEANFKYLQTRGKEFLNLLLAFGPFNKHLSSIKIFSSNQPHKITKKISDGIYDNQKFNSIIDKLFITDGERKNTDFSKDDNSMYMTKLKTGRVMKMFGISDQEVASILTTLRGGGRRTSRRKQTKSRNPRKRKSTKQRRGKSMKYRKL